MERDMAKPTNTTDGHSLNSNLSQQAEGFRRVAAPLSEARVDLGTGQEIVIIGGERRNVVEVINHGNSPDDENNDHEGISGADRKRKNGHTSDQIREMEMLFKAFRHPDEAQRQELGDRMGLTSQQVKFWFQNRRTQSKNMQERHVNACMRNEMQLMREENEFLREIIKNTSCFNCGFHAPSPGEQYRLLVENSRLQDQIERLQRSFNVSSSRTSAPLGLMDMSEIMELVEKAKVEVVDLAGLGETVWLFYMGNGCGNGVTNKDKNVSRYRFTDTISPGRCIEVSREFVIVYGDVIKLVECFMDVNQWKDIFSSIVSKATILDVLNEGKVNNNNDGRVQLMVAEFQMLTPIVLTREVHFIRRCKQLGPKKWVIVDLAPSNSVEGSDDDVKFRRRPSGCIIEENVDGRCKVMWVEQMECEYFSIASDYPGIVCSAFGAKHWAMTLRQQCERLIYSMAANYYISVFNGDETRIGLKTIAERKNIMTLAHKMTANFCQAMGKSSPCEFVSSTSSIEDHVRVSIRRNINGPGEPIGVILCAVTSIWLPVSRPVLFDYLKDESQKHQWDVMLNGNAVHTVATFAKGPNQDNSVKFQTIDGLEDNIRLLEDSSINEFESMLVFASVEIPIMQSVTKGGDLDEVRLLASGFSILRDGLDTNPSTSTASAFDRNIVMGSASEERNDCGCLLTLFFQLLASNSPMEELTMDSVNSIRRLVSFSLVKIMERFNRG